MNRKQATPSSCPVYKKIFQALENTSIEMRHTISDSACRQASRYKIPSRLSAQEIIAAIRMKQAEEVQDKHVSPSSEPGNQGTITKKYPPSENENRAEYVQRLVNLGYSLAAATEAADEIFGPRDNPVSGKTRKAVLARLEKAYPNLSEQSRELIVNEAIRESVVKSNIGKTRKTISGLQANSRHINTRNGSVQKEIPAYITINAFNDGKYLPFDTSNLKSASHERGGRNWLTIEQFRNKGAIEESEHSEKKIKSANTIINPLWVGKDFNRNMIDYYNQRRTNNIKQASTTSDNRPAWLVISDHLKGQ